MKTVSIGRFLEILNLVILGILTVNTFYDFLSPALEFVAELVAVCLIYNQNVPKITRDYFRTPNGVFTERWDIKFYYLSFGVLGYYVATLWFHQAFYRFEGSLTNDIWIIFLILFIFIMAFPFAWIWKHDNISLPAIEQSFYQQLLKQKTPDQVKKSYKEFYGNPRHWLFYAYIPALVVSSLACFLFLISFFLALFSNLFSLIFIGYMILFITKKKRKGMEISEEKFIQHFNIIKILTPDEITGFKRMSGYLIILVNLFPPAILLCFSLSVSIFTIVTIPYFLGLLVEIMMLPTLIFQVIFWYTLLQRFPVLINHFNFLPNTKLPLKIPRLPAGGLIAFFLSTGFWIGFGIISSFSDIAEKFPMLFFIIAATINAVIIAFLAHTIVRKTKYESVNMITNDNLIIPVTAVVFIWWGIGLFVRDQFKDFSIILIFLCLTAGLIIMFFDMEWKIFIRKKVQNKLMLCYCNFFTFLFAIFLMNICAAIIDSSFLLFFLVLDLILVAVIVRLIKIQEREFALMQPK